MIPWSIHGAVLHHLLSTICQAQKADTVQLQRCEAHRVAES